MKLYHFLRHLIIDSMTSEGQKKYCRIYDIRKFFSLLPKSFKVSDRIYRSVIALVTGFVSLVWTPVLAGPYRDSAHGNASYGVNRSPIDETYTAFTTGNCAHCHESHASVDGAEPSPANGPAPHALFSESFNQARIENFYLETDDFCFYCHSDISGQQVINQDYSTVFGGGNSGEGPQSIMAAFNQASYHNLYDIWNFLNNDDTFSAWFSKLGNPCSACHNSHLAKRNWDSGQPSFPLLSAISMPGASGSLWGEEGEVMSTNYSYEAPYAYLEDREPGKVGNSDGDNTPDYVAFCTSCHNKDNIIWSTNLDRELRKINWGTSGLSQNKHGGLGRDGTDNFREPYTGVASLKNNLVMSCLDCHESHGSENIMLLRRRINGENLEGTVDSTDSMSYVCKRCHTDDLAAAAGTGETNRWQYIHHAVADAPYSQVNCIDCHSTVDGNTPIACGNCHGHGMDDTILGVNASGRKTF